MRNCGRLSSLLFALAIPAGLAPAQPALAGAWTLGEGEVLAIASTTVVEARSGFGGDGADHLVPDLSKTEVQLLLEAGLSDRLTFVLRPQYQSVEVAPPVAADRDGPGYTEIGLRRLLWEDGETVLSAQLLARLPGTRDDRNPAAQGHTEPQADLRLLVGRSFQLFDRPAFAETQLAYRASFGDAGGEARADFTLGIRPRERLLLLAQSFNVMSDGSADFPFTETRYHKVQLSAVWEFAENWSIQIGAVATVAGEDALKERGVVAALWRRF